MLRRWVGLIMVVVGLIGVGLPESARAQSPYITEIAWRPDGQQVAVGYFSGQIEIRNYPTGQLQQTFSLHQQAVTTIAWNWSGDQIASGAMGEVFVWNPSTAQVIADFAANYGSPIYVEGLGWTQNGDGIAVFLDGSNFQLWDASTYQLILERYDPAGDTVTWDISRNHIVSLVSIKDPINFQSIAYYDESTVIATAWSLGAERIVTGDWSGQIRIWDVPSEVTPSETLPELPLNRTLRASTVEPDFDRRTTFVMAVAFSLSSNRVYSVSGSGEFTAWDANNGTLISTTQLENAPITAAAFNQLGTKVAYGDANGELHIVDVATLAPPETFGALPTFFRISDGQAANRLLQ